VIGARNKPKSKRPWKEVWVHPEGGVVAISRLNPDRRRKHHHHHKKGGDPPVITLSFWEQFIVSAAISLLTVLESKVSNQVELEAIQAAIAFLQKLVSGTVAMKGA